MYEEAKKTIQVLIKTYAEIHKIEFYAESVCIITTELKYHYFEDIIELLKYCEDNFTQNTKH